MVAVSVPDLLGSSEPFYSHFFLPLRIRGNLLGPIHYHGRSTAMRVAQRFSPAVVVFFLFLTTRSTVFSFAFRLFPSVLAILVEFTSHMAVRAISSFPRMIGTLFPILDMLAQHLGLVFSGMGITLAFSSCFAFAFALLRSSGCICSLSRLGSFGQSSTRRPACICWMMTIRTVWPIALSVLFHPKANWRTTRVWILLNRRYVRRTFTLFAFTFAFLRRELPSFRFLESFVQLRITFGITFGLCLVISFLRCHCMLLACSARCIECSFACLDYFQFDKDLVAFFPSFWLTHGRSSCSVRSGSSVQTNLFSKSRSDLLYISDELFCRDHSEPDLFHVLAGSLPSCLELDGTHLLMLIQSVPFASHSKLPLNSCFQKLVEPLFDGFIHLSMGSIFLHSVFSFLHYVFVDDQARA